MVSIPLGIVTSLAIAAHEIPQEIGDFGILLHKGLRRRKVLLVNFISALASVGGAVLTYFIGGDQIPLSMLLSLTAGFFIYIAASDIIPEIHHENRQGFALVETFLMFLGVVGVYLAIYFLDGFHS